MSIYLDYNASAPIDLRVLEYMNEIYRQSYGNPDSRTHSFGDNARQVVEVARKQVATLAGVKKEEVFFTSGATEGNNIVIQGLVHYGIENNKKHIVVSAIEHKAIIESVKNLIPLGFDVDFIYPEINGCVNVTKVLKHVRNDTLLVSIMHVNNETGIIQPVAELGEQLEKKGILFHIDATQSFGKLVDEIRELKYDMMTLSAHKIAGPQGIGALILRKKRYKLPPVKAIMYGGEQERGIRPGTVPVALVAGLGKACELLNQEYKNNNQKTEHIKTEIMNLLEHSGLQYKTNGDSDFCISNTINVCIKGVSSEALMLSSKQFCGISNGSACNSHKYEPSHVLQAMRIATEDIDNSIRISWGPNTECQEVIKQFSELLEIAKGLAF